MMAESGSEVERDVSSGPGMDPDGHKTSIIINAWWCNRFWYMPLSLIIILGFIFGGYLTFYLYFNMELHSSGLFANEQARYYLHLFGAGMIGTSLYCTFLFAADANVKMYTGVKLPTPIDIFGYAIYIIGGGVTGLVFYFFVAAGVLVVATNGEDAEIRPLLAGLLAFSGGYVTDGVKAFINRWFKKIASTFKSN